MKKRILSMILAVFMMVGLLPSAALPAMAAESVWDGYSIDTTWYTSNTSATTFHIGTAAELAGLASLVNNGTTTFQNNTIYLDADIDIKNKAWTPIGNGSGDGRYFNGTFDGQGHVISNVRVLVSDNNKYLSAGLFGSAGNTIRNLGVVDVVSWCNLENKPSGYYAYSGGIAGRSATAIENCYTYSTQPNVQMITVMTSGTSGDGSGGIVGQILSGKVSGCYSNTKAVGMTNVGNIAGEAVGNIDSCYWFSSTLGAKGGGTGAVTNSSQYTDNDDLVKKLNTWVKAKQDPTLYLWKIEGGRVVHDIPWSASYTATVTVNKDGSQWTSGAPVINLSYGWNGNTGIAATSNSNGVYTFSNLDPDPLWAYFIWEKGTPDTYTNLYVQSATNAATLNYYSLSLAKGTGIASVSGSGIYLSGKSANINATPSAGYEWDKWSDNNTTQNRAFTVNAKTDLIAYARLMDTTAPTLSGNNPTAVSFGYTTAPSMTVSITNKDDTNFNYSYEWYTATGTAIAGATSETYTAPAALDAGTHNYTVRVIATNKADNSKTAFFDKTFAVTVNKASGSVSVAMAGWTYGDSKANPVPTSTTNGTGGVSYTYAGRNGTTYANSEIKPENAGDYTVTATFAASGNYAQSTATADFTIAKATLTPSVASVTGKVYDGYTTASGTISLSGAVKGEQPTAIGTFAWTHKNAGTATVNVTDISLSDSWGNNYALSTTSLTYVTAPGGAKLSPKELTIAPQTAVYNGTATISVSEYPTGIGSEKVTLTYTLSTKNTDTYTFGTETNGFTLALSDTNYSVGSAGNLTVSPKGLTIPANSVIYNGDTSFSASITGENGENVIVTYTTHAKDVGNYTYDGVSGDGKYTMSLSDSTNYSVFSGGTLTVNPLPAALTWDYAEPFTYDKTEKSVTAMVNNKIGDDIFTISYIGNSGTSKGGYTATVTELGNSNYTLAGASGVTQNWDIIAQKVSKPTADATVFTYTGSEQTYTIAPNVLYTVTNNKRTNAGSQDVTVALNDKSNYTWSEGNTEDLAFTFTIAKAPVTFAVSGNSYTYDGVSKTATVTQTQNETPSMAGNFYVTYQQSGSTVTPNDAGNYDVMVTLNDDNFKFEGQEDWVRTGKVVDLTINKKPVMALWQNLHHVYDGTAKTITFGVTGIETGDKNHVTAQLSEGSRKTAAGSYPVVAELTGTRSSNYTLTNPMGTLVIQKAPVTFTVSNDSVQYNGSACAATVTANANSCAFTDIVVTYRKDGKDVSAPTEVGSYDIYASISNDNYRHADITDGKARKVGVLNIYKTAAPASYTFSFSGGSGATGTMASLPATQPGTLLILPQNAFTKTGSIFTGWRYNGKVYQPNESIIQGSSNITMTAQWADFVYSISGKVNQNSNPAADAVVFLMRGSEKLAETVTDTNGDYHFATVVPGMYNMVASKNGITQTVMVEIVAADASDKNISLPLGKTNSVVQVDSGSPAIVVGNLEQTFIETDSTVYTEEDKGVVMGGGSVEIKLSAKAVTADENNTDQAEIAKKAMGTVALYLDLNLEKTVTSELGVSTTTKIPVSNVLLESVIQLPGELQGKYSYTVYRIHNSVLNTLTTTPNKDGEYIKVNTKGTALTVYCKNFSTYAIAYTTYSGGDGAISMGTYPISIDTAITGGSIQVDKQSAALGTKVTITAKPNEGYKLSKLTLIDENGKSITYQDNGDGTYSFIMPSTKITVTPVFEKTDSSFPFVDVTEAHWARKSIEWAYGKNIFAGTSKTTFAPNAATTRGMIITTLFRMEGSPSGFEKAAFSDVAADSYCAAAVGWGLKQGIIKGYTIEKYIPEENITREQLATILYRYVEFKNYNLNKTTSLDKFTDGKQVTEYAKKAMSWAVATDLFSGKGNGILDPMGKATRAEVATLLMRFNTIFGK